MKSNSENKASEIHFSVMSIGILNGKNTLERKSITEHLSACDFGIHIPGLDHALISLRFSPLQEPAQVDVF